MNCCSSINGEKVWKNHPTPPTRCMYHGCVIVFPLPPSRRPQLLLSILSSDTPSSKLAASGGIRIGHLWLRSAASWRLRRKAPQTKSSRCRRLLALSGIYRRRDTGKPTATLSSDKAAPVQSYLHSTRSNGALLLKRHFRCGENETTAHEQRDTWRQCVFENCTAAATWALSWYCSHDGLQMNATATRWYGCCRDMLMNGGIETVVC